MEQLSFFEAERKLLPEMDILLEKRFRILRAIQLADSIGRRVLAEVLHLTEREIRNETTILQQQGLILIQQKGMICTEQGYEVLENLKTLFHELSGLSNKEKLLAKRFGIEKVVIVAGHLEEDATILQQIGKEASQEFISKVKANSKIALTGGSSVAAIGPHLSPIKPFASAQFIPARGGMGDDLQLQANTLAAQFAQQCHSKYRTLFLPEHLSEQAYDAMIQEPAVQELMALYEETNIVIHGIGEANEMANRRNSDNQVKAYLQEQGAVGEAFGYYYDQQGNIVHHLRTIGIQLEQVKRADVVIAIAGGKKKANAIQAYFKNASDKTILVTDESAANEIINGFN